MTPMRTEVRMRIARLLLWPLLALALAGAPGPAAASPRSIDAVYDVYLSGIRLGEMRLQATIGRLSYTAVAKAKTTGLVKQFAEVGFAAMAGGRTSGAGLRPQRFEARTRSSKKRQALEIEYTADRPSRLLADPPFKPKPWEIDPMEQGGKPDPLTGGVMAISPERDDAVCGRSVEVFDGRKRYDLVPVNTQIVDSEVICRAVIRRVAGFKPKHMSEPDIELTLWYDRGADGKLLLLRAETMTSLGTASMRRRGAG